MKKFKGKYRIGSMRLQSWDYSSNGLYFITICTAKRELFFGDIVEGKMELSDIGSIAHNNWLAIPRHFPYVKLDTHIIMPNHIHGLLRIEKPVNEARQKGQFQNTEKNKTTENIQTHAASQRWKPKSLGSIINQYKRACTIAARKIDPLFAWQSRYYESILWDMESAEKARYYIFHNPKNWEKAKDQMEFNERNS